MKGVLLTFATLTALAISTATAQQPAQTKSSDEKHEHHVTASSTQPEAWQKLQGLAGDWQGTTKNENESAPTHILFRPSSGGTSLVQTIDPGGKYEMITVFHLDGAELLGTHYCFGNQPRFRAVSSNDPKTIVFELKDMTGKDSPGHMHRLVLTMTDADHHIEDWTYLQNGKEITDRFEMTRVK